MSAGAGEMTGGGGERESKAASERASSRSLQTAEQYSRDENAAGGGAGGGWGCAEAAAVWAPAGAVAGAGEGDGEDSFPFAVLRWDGARVKLCAGVRPTAVAVPAATAVVGGG